MNENDSTPVVACTLTDERQVERSERVESLLAGRYERAEEREEGFTLLFEGVDESLRAVAAFVAAERQCCSFATYRIEVEPPYERTRLTVTGPEGTKPLFRDGLVERLETR